MLKTIRYYRHSETKWNNEGRLQGWLDSELTEQGIVQAKQVTWQPDIVFCSDLQRAIKTAEYMFPNINLVKTALLREIDLGNWQGQLIEELAQDQGYQSYMKTPHLFKATSQECFNKVTNRMLFFHEQILTIPYEKIAVVSHGVSLACLHYKLNEGSLEQLWNYMLPNATYVAYQVGLG